MHFTRVLLISTSLVPTCKIKCIVFLHWNGLYYGVCGGKTCFCAFYTCGRRCDMWGLLHTMHNLWGGGEEERKKTNNAHSLHISVCTKKLESIRHLPSVASDDCLTPGVPSDPSWWVSRPVVACVRETIARRPSQRVRMWLLSPLRCT